MKQQNVPSLPDAYLFFDSSFGYVVPLEKIQADPCSYASVFCEGSVALRNLLYDLWQQGVETRGCCKGHESVHFYVKDSLFGRGFQYIDEKTYLSHARSKRYRHIEAEGKPYLAFRPERFGEAQKVCDRVESRMKEQLPELSYRTNAFPDLITISLERYTDPPLREKFFSVLSSVLQQELKKSKEEMKESVSQPNTITSQTNNNLRKKPLDALIQAAAFKITDNRFEGTEKKKATAHHR